MKAKNTKSNKTPKVDVYEDSLGVREPTKQELERISAMAERLVQIQQAKDKLEERLEELNSEIERIKSADLPGLMDEVGMSEFRLKSGDAIVVKPIVTGNLPAYSAILKEKDAEKRAELKYRFEQGMKYLVKHGAGSLIKNHIVAELGKDSVKLSKQAIAALKAIGIDQVTWTQGIHPGALNSWIRERIENGADIDYDLFRIYTGHRAEVKRATKAATKRAKLSRALK